MGGCGTTTDLFIGGRVEAVQPAEGHHRAGLEAVLLAASLSDDTAGTVADLGAGAGVAGLCVAARCPAAEVVLVEREPALVACAGAALVRPANGAFAARLRIAEADALSARGRAAAGLSPASIDHVIANPPFHVPGKVRASPRSARAGAHVLGEEGVAAWLRAAAAIARPGGTATVIFRADALLPLLEAMAGRFGALQILPVHPRAEAPASRVLVRGVKGSRSRAVSLLAPLVLHGRSGSRFLPPVERMLREGASLAEAHAPWQNAVAGPS